MNSVVRQLLEQQTDVVMVDTGDSYEGICGYYKGTYISYSKEKPISMNPFKVTKEEYDQNFGEKKNFLKSLIFLIYKGNEFPTKIEDMLINQTIVEYYEAYFHPFTKFTEKEREGLRQKLLVASKMEEDYDKFSHSMEDMARYVDRIMVMNDGVKMFDDTPKEVFRHYKELEAIGLAAPQITYVVQGLRERGIPIDDAITTVEEAREAILALYNKRREKQ